MLFSERNGYKSFRDIVQKNNISTELRNRIWSIFYEDIFSKYSSNVRYRELFQPLINKIWTNFFKEALDEQPTPMKTTQIIKSKAFFSEWFVIYDFIEFVLSNQPPNVSFGHIRAYDSSILTKRINSVLEDEFSAYRLINNQVTEITSEQEIQSIEEAMQAAGKFSSVKQHLQTALNLMSDRQNPDYRNSIKESISAVESICKIVTADSSATLGKALKLVDDKYGLHPALKSSLSSLYGYTSDADGIRHAMMEESNLTFMDAKFMLVSCTNFINYLTDKTKT